MNKKHFIYVIGNKNKYELVEDMNDVARPTIVNKTNYKYKYNGKEWHDELGLNMYDMDMRQYLTIARWVVMDPIVHHSMSPYNSFDNNPVFWADPSGADAEGSDALVRRKFDDFGMYILPHQRGEAREVLQNKSKEKEEEGNDDIIFINNKREEIGRIVLDGDHVYIKVDTDSVPPSPIEVELVDVSAQLGMNLDAIGINIEVSGVLGGGLQLGFNFTYFLNGKDAGNLYGYNYFGGGVGLEGSIGVYAVGSVFN
jgi:RHS repeat-associated protein